MQIIQDGLRLGITANCEFSTADNANSNETRETRPAEEAISGSARKPLKRWVPSRKAEIVDAVRGGFISLDDALERYALSIDEYLMWQRGLELFGYAGLRVNRTKHLRQATTRSENR
jgi:Protein of unknown function (DUF1153)